MTEENPAGKAGYLAVIDIGSNSVRLVVFSGRTRVPSTVFNEKIMCGLGAEVGVTGRMGDKAIASAMSTLKRFRALCDQMQVAETLVVATAAVRDAENGPDFVERVFAETGFKIDIIPGTEEGRLSGLGVLSGEPAATGIVGDLGGGSLELAQVRDGIVVNTISLPLGPLRLISRFGSNYRLIKEHLRQEFRSIAWLIGFRNTSLYMVGGAWRNLAKLLMREKFYPLPILHGFTVSKSDMVNYCRRIGQMGARNIPFGTGLPQRRLEILPVAAIILQELLSEMKAANASISAYGLREGLIFDKLSKPIQQMDPFLHTCRVLAEERCRFAEHAEVIFDWSRPLFKTRENSKQQTKLHMAICLLGDIAWRGHPDFRAEKAVESVLHGNFVGISHAERAFIAVALNQAYGAPVDAPHMPQVLTLLKVKEITEARMMGAALRLAQRLSGGAVAALMVSQLRVTKKYLWLGVPAHYQDITNEVVAKRLADLARLMGRSSAVEFPSELDEVSVG